MAPEICTKMLRNFTEKLRAKLTATTRGYSMVIFASLDDAFSEFFELEVSRVEDQSLQQKDKKKRKRKDAKCEKTKSLQDVHDSCASPSK